MRKRELWLLGIIAAIGLLAVATPRTYVLTPNGSWPRGDTVTMYLQLGTARVTLLDGATSWNDVAATAVSMWDRQLGSIDFVSRIENRSRRSGDGVNDVFWADDVYGDAFGDGLAAAVTWHRGDHRIEADVLFNRAKSWNSYRGPWRSGLADFRRMALYEFGWVLGLGHPDKAGQSVLAIMNWSGDGSEDLQDDDIRGIRALYGEPPAPPGLAMPPRADTIDFRHAMETEYRNRGAVGSTTFVDINAGATWLAEYVWYRVSLCDHATAVARVFAQLEGRGVQPVCGTPAVVEQLPEPAEIVTFREELETEFRDFLKGPPNDYLMPQNEEAYLVREYLLQRFSGFDHRQATDRLRPPFRVPTPTPRPNPTPAPSPAPAPAPQPAPAPSPGPPPPAGGRFDGIYDFSVTHGAPGGGVQTRSFPRWFIVRNGRITNSEGNVTGSVLDNFGNVSFNGPCWANQSGATFTGILNAGSGPKFGQGNSVCTSGGHTASWRAFNGS